MVDGDDFRTTVRRGGRAGQPALVAHVLVGGDGPTRVGLVVSRAVGSAVDRNRVKRRLRHLMRERVAAVPEGSRVVVRALPPAAATSYEALGDQLDVSLRKAGAR